MGRKQKIKPFEYVDVVIEGEGVYFGDLLEVKQALKKKKTVPLERGEYRAMQWQGAVFLMANKNLTIDQLKNFWEVPLERGEYRAMQWQGAVFLMANKNLTIDQLKKFWEDMFPRGYTDGRPDTDTFHLPITRWGRYSVCMEEAYNEDFNDELAIVVCDSSLPPKEIKNSERPEYLHRKYPIVEGWEGRGVFSLTYNEYNYASIGGKEVLFVNGCEFPEDYYEEIFEKLEEVWDPPAGLLIKGDSDSPPPPSSSPSPPPSSTSSSSSGEKRKRESEGEKETKKKKKKR